MTPLDLGPPLRLKEQKSTILLLLLIIFKSYNFLCISDEIKTRY